MSMAVMTARAISHLHSSISVLFLTAFCMSNPVTAATVSSNDAGTEWQWNLLIALIVLLVTAASAALTLAAIKQWSRGWRIGATIPLLVLLAWLIVIAVSRLLSEESHQLWPFEIFAWAMLNMIYMVALMTAKRIFEKADEKADENADSSG